MAWHQPVRIWNLHHNWTVSLVEGFSLRNWICLCIEPLAHHYTSSVPDLFFIFINLFIYLLVGFLWSILGYQTITKFSRSWNCLCQWIGRGYNLLVSKVVQPVGGAELDFIRAKAYIITKPSFTKTIKKNNKFTQIVLLKQVSWGELATKSHFNYHFSVSD